MDVTIRPARPDEAPELSELALRAKGHWGYDAAFLEACRAELRVDPGDCDARTLFVADAAGVPVGFYRIVGDPPAGELADLFVDPPAIGSGVGGRLLAHAKSTASALGFRALTIDADPHAESFYRHAGAIRAGDVPSGSISGRRLPRLELRL